MKTRQREEHYYQPGAGWSKSAEGATHRLRARAALQVTAVVENTLERRTSSGEWEQVELDEQSPVLRGLVWRAWRSVRKEQLLLQLRGVRALEPKLSQELLAELDLRDSDGDVIPQPEGAGLEFALPLEDARVFAKRVRLLGGGIIPSPPPLPDSDSGDLAAIAVGVQLLREIVESGESMLEHASEVKTLIDLPLIEEQQKEVLRLYGETLGELERGLDRALHEEGQLSASELAAIAEHRKRYMDLQAELLSLYTQYQSQLKRAVSLMQGAGGDAGSRREETLLALGEHLAQSGQITTYKDGILTIHLEGGTVTIGDHVGFGS